jgi:hypothetical protein
MNTLTKVPTPTSTSPTYAPVLAPTSFSELVQFAQMAAKSQLVPKEYRNQPEDIMLAVQLGSEVGLRPMQALQNIAVINGRPAVWGDALPGLCKASPVYHDIIETWEHEQDLDLLTAVCIAKRHGSTPVTARFSVMDAKRAGLWTKAGPWQTYPRRMLQMRARSFALRDASPDVLKGLISVEEALDNHAGADQLAPSTRCVAAPSWSRCCERIYRLILTDGALLSFGGRRRTPRASVPPWRSRPTRCIICRLGSRRLALSAGRCFGASTAMARWAGSSTRGRSRPSSKPWPGVRA